MYMPIMCKHDVITKPEVNSVLRCRQKLTEPRPQTTCRENIVKFGHVVFEICKRTDRQTYIHTDTLMAVPRAPSRGELLN